MVVMRSTTSGQMTESQRFHTHRMAHRAMLSISILGGGALLAPALMKKTSEAASSRESVWTSKARSGSRGPDWARSLR